jgi:transposase
MAKPKPATGDPKGSALAQDGALNPHPEAVSDALFTSNPFFDARDLVQVRYEMVRRHQADGVPISEVASDFGVSRPTFYKAQSALADQGLPGLVPLQRGPKGGHKLSAEVVAFVDELKAARPDLTVTRCIAEITAHFGITVHRRSLERAMARKKNDSTRRSRWSGQSRRHLRTAAGDGARRPHNDRGGARRSPPSRHGRLDQGRVHIPGVHAGAVAARARRSSRK